MVVRLRPIRAKRPIVGLNAQQVRGRLRDVGVEAMSLLSAYPPARTRYRRTGRLGAAWTLEGPIEQGGGLTVTAGNAIVYAGPVQGFKRRRPRQGRVFRRYNWPNVEDVGKQAWKARGPRLLAALQGR